MAPVVFVVLTTLSSFLFCLQEFSCWKLVAHPLRTCWRNVAVTPSEAFLKCSGGSFDLQHRRNIPPKRLEHQQGATKRLPRPSGRGSKKDLSDGHLRRSPGRCRRDVCETLPHASFPLQVPAAATPALGGRSSHAGVRRARAAFIHGGAIHSGGPPRERIYLLKESIFRYVS